MPRGNMPRKPSRSGQHDRARATKPPAAKKSANVSRATLKSAPPVEKGPAKARSGYDPVNPTRVRAIIAGLDAMYPGVTCALTHRSAWELVVATILSAQCTDVRV